MSTQYDNRDSAQIFVRSVVNQIQNLNLTALDKKQVEDAVAEAVIQSLPQIVSHPQLIAHIRKVAIQVLDERLNAQGKGRVSASDAEKTAQIIWSQAESEIGSTLASLVGQARKTVERVFKKATPEYQEVVITLEPRGIEIFEIQLNKGDVMETRRKSLEVHFPTTVRLKGGDDIKFPRNDGTTSTFFDIDHSGFPARFRAPASGAYWFEFCNTRYERKEMTIQYRLIEFGN